MEFSEVKSKEKEVRRTEHFSAAEGMGSSQGSVCSVTQAYTWGAGRDHLPQEFSFHKFLSEHSIVNLYRYDRLSFWRPVTNLTGTENILVHSFSPIWSFDGGWLPGEKKHGQGGPKVCSCHVDPHVKRERLDEGEKIRRRWRRLLVQDTNSWKWEIISWRYSLKMRNDKNENNWLYKPCWA